MQLRAQLHEDAQHLQGGRWELGGDGERGRGLQCQDKKRDLERCVFPQAPLPKLEIPDPQYSFLHSILAAMQGPEVLGLRKFGGRARRRHHHTYRAKCTPTCIFPLCFFHVY